MFYKLNLTKYKNLILFCVKTKISYALSQLNPTLEIGIARKLNTVDTRIKQEK